MSLILESNIKLIHSYSGVALGENLAFLLQGLWLVLLAIDLAVNHTKDKKLFIPPMIIGVGIIIYSLEQFGGIFSGPGVMNTPLQAAWPVWPMALGWASLNAEKRKKLHLTTKVAIGYSWGFVVLMFLV